MTFRLFLCIAVAVLAFFYSRELTHENLAVTDDIDVGELDPEGPCGRKIKDVDSLWKFMKDCLEFPKESMDCVAKQLEVRETDTFIIGLECLPNLPEEAKEIWREIARTMSVRTEIASKCDVQNELGEFPKDCNHEYMTLDQKYKELVEKYMELRNTFQGVAIRADEKFRLLVIRVASDLGYVQ